MAKLIMKFNDEVIDHIDLVQGDMKIGRRATCEIYIDNLAISGEHANLFTIGGDSFIQDLGSTNGTFVNNKKIAKFHLKNGDVIAIGKHTFIYFGESEEQEVKTEDFAKTVIIDAGAPSSPPPAAEPSALAKDTIATSIKKKPKSDRTGAIFVLSGSNSGKRIDLVKPITNLGKTGKVAGTIAQDGDGYKLSASSSFNAPKLNGRDLRVGEECDLKNGDIIEVAGTRLQFYLK